MYAATMLYPVKEEVMDDFVALWKERILSLAVDQPGFVRMQLMIRDDEALAIGVWQDKSFAEAFMALGPFKNLLSALDGMLTGQPIPTVWTLVAKA